MSGPRIYTGAEALALAAAATPGPWAVDEGSLAFDVVDGHDCPVATVESPEVEYRAQDAADAALLAAAPDLAASVAHHEAEATAARADRDAALAHAAELERALREALRDRDRAEERSRLHAADANRAAERWASANGRIAAADVELATACRLRDDAGRLADALRAERDALRAAVREEMAAEREARGGIRHIAARDALRRLATEAPDAR